MLETTTNLVSSSMPMRTRLVTRSHPSPSFLTIQAVPTAPLQRLQLPKLKILSRSPLPDPGLFGIKDSLAELRGVPNDAFVFLGVGSDEVLDLVQRVCCRPGKDKILICPPTYGMYSVCAAVNDLEVVKVPLITEGGKFALNVEAVNKKLSEDPDIKIAFICSPGNPTGTLIPPSESRRLRITKTSKDWSLSMKHTSTLPRRRRGWVKGHKMKS